MRFFPWITLLSAALAVVLSRAADADGVLFFEKQIRPILVVHCYGCHSAEARMAEKLKGGLLLDTKAALLKGGDTGAVIVPGKPDESLLIKGLRYSDELRMPPKGKLAANVVADFETWIKMG